MLIYLSGLTIWAELTDQLQLNQGQTLIKIFVDSKLGFAPVIAAAAGGLAGAFGGSLLSDKKKKDDEEDDVEELDIESEE